VEESGCGYETQNGLYQEEQIVREEDDRKKADMLKHMTVRCECDLTSA